MKKRKPIVRICKHCGTPIYRNKTMTEWSCIWCGRGYTLDDRENVLVVDVDVLRNMHLKRWFI